MAKILTDTEVAQIAVRATKEPYLIDDADNYQQFLEGLAELITNHFGGQLGRVDCDANLLGWTVSFYPNESLPDDGGIFKDYDKDVTWKDGREI